MNKSLITSFRDMEYIILEGKTPTHGFKDGNGTRSYDDVKDFDNLAVIVPEGYVVLDFDTASDADIMLKIVDGLKLKTLVFKTTRGIHCWFRSSEENPKNFIKNRLAVGIYSDRKVGGRNSFVKIKQDGSLRKQIRKCKLSELDTIPRWLTSVSAPSGKFTFKDMGEGSGRNQELFNYIVYLQFKGFSKDEIRKTIEIINDYVFTEPLPDSEITTILRDESFKPEDQVQTYDVGDKFKHNHFGKYLIQKYHIVSVDGKLWAFVDNRYQHRPDLIDALCIKEYDGITIRNRRETVAYIEVVSPRRSFSDPRYILFKNGILDILSGDLLTPSTDHIIPNYIPHDYKPDAYDLHLDKVLTNVSCNDPEIRAIIEETLGYTFYRENVVQKAIIFTGSGKNGKSTILNIFEEVLTENNYSAEPLERLTDRFSTVSLYGKLANISDDIDSIGTVNSSVFKRICVKGSISAEYKGKDKFTFVSYATPIFTANDVPKIGRGDDADAVNRRLIIVPFNADFSPESPNYDMHIEQKIRTQNAIEYAVALAVEGLKRVLKNGFTVSKSAEAEKSDYIHNTDSCIAYFDYLADKYDDPRGEYITKELVNAIRLNYEYFCRDNGFEPCNATVFGKRIKKHYHLSTDLVKVKGKGRKYKID